MQISTCMQFKNQRPNSNTSSFALRLYEYLRTSKYLLAYTKAVDVPISLAELKIRTGIVQIDNVSQRIIDRYGFTDETLNIIGNPYPKWMDFKKRVLDPAINEINTLGSLHVDYVPMKTGRANKVVGVKFTIKRTDTSAGLPEDVIDSMRKIITEPLGSDDLMEIYKESQENLEEVSAEYALAKKQMPQIHDLKSWLVAAIKGKWAHQTQNTDTNPELKLAIRNIINEPLSDYALSAIAKAAQGDIQLVQDAYALACKQTSSIKDLSKWLISAITNKWQDDDPVQKQPSRIATQKDYSRNPFNQFEQNKYDFDALETDLVRNI